MKNNNQRLRSLDILRGFDLFLLVFLQPLLLSVLGLCPPSGFTRFLQYQLDHEVWVGFRAWDLVMPLFLFMCGVAMPFSFAKYKEASKASVLGKMIKRVLILWMLGMVVQGHLLSLNPAHFHYFSNTLQAIAVGYFFTGLALLYLPKRGQFIFLLLTLLAYWLPMTISGDFTLEGNLATKIDSALLGSHRGDPSYTWILSSLGFIATVMLGAFAGHIVRRPHERVKNAQCLLLVGMALIAGGLALSFQMPIIKRIWSTSMVLFSGGLCYVLLAACYYVIDCKQHTRGLMWLCYYGMNSIIAYMLGEWLNFRGLIRQLTYGLEPYCGDAYNLVLTLGQGLVVFFILRAMFLCQKFVKV